MSMDAILSQLNEQQLEAVKINEGSLLVFAGAGSKSFKRRHLLACKSILSLSRA